MSYNPASQITNVNFASGETDAYAYDVMNRMNNYSYVLGSSSVVGIPTWSSNGTLRSLNITDQFNPANTQNCTYSYEDLARISGVNCTGSVGWAQIFNYDQFGNNTKSGSSSWLPGYNTLTNQYSGVGATYDGNGNLTFDTFNHYTWDADANIATVNVSTSNTYDAFDQLVETSMGPTQFLYLPNGTQPFASMSNYRTYLKVFAPAPGGTMVITPNGKEGVIAYHRHTDWIGSSRFASTPAGTVYSDVAYAPFGEPYAPSGTQDLVFGSNTQDASVVEGATAGYAYDTLNRKYSAAQSRWISPDPAGISAVDPTNPQSWNRYAYALNNPLSNIDPSGLECVWDDGSFDSADDPDTGSADKCGAAGGSWVNPDLFENAMLTSGQWNSNYGDWSSSANSYLAQNWTVASGTAYGGEWAAGQEVDEAINEFYGNGPKPTIVYGPNDPFTLSFRKSMGMQGILAGIKANCSATSGRVFVGTGEAFVNTMIDGPFLQSPDGRVSGYETPEAQMGAFNSTYTRSGGVVEITVTNPISLNSLALHMTAPLGIPNSTSGHFGTVNQQLQLTAPDPCQ